MRHHAIVLAAAIALGTTPVGAPAAVHFFTATLDGAQETPPNLSKSKGTATLTLDDTTGVVSYTINQNCCASGETNAHVHGPAAPGVPAGIIYGLPPGPSKVGASPALTAPQQADMLANLHYINVHSNDIMAGEIRGQIIFQGTATGQLKPTKTLLVKNPPAGATKRKILWKVKELASGNTVIGDPTNAFTGGATLRVALTPGGDQCFDLPAANWSPVGSIGFKYKDTDLSEGAVKTAFMKKTPSGTFLIKALLKGDGPEGITVVPGNQTTSYGVNLAIGNGDTYCSGTGTATPSPNDDKTFKAKNDTTPASCPVSACSPSGAFLETLAPF